MNTIRVYESAIDPWFYPLLIGGPWMVTAVSVYFTAHTLQGVWVGAIVGLAAFLASWPFARPCRYTVSDQALHIQSGFLEIVLPVSNIRSAERMRSFLAAPCLSIDRVLITTTEGKEMVSPADREAFIADLLSRAKTQVPAQPARL